MPTVPDPQTAATLLLPSSTEELEPEEKEENKSSSYVIRLLHPETLPPEAPVFSDELEVRDISTTRDRGTTTIGSLDSAQKGASRRRSSARCANHGFAKRGCSEVDQVGQVEELPRRRRRPGQYKNLSKI